jgi:hypothetical protein
LLSDTVHAALWALVRTLHDATGARHRLSFGIAYYDSERDRVITHVAAFGPAVTALQADPAIISAYGNENADRLAIQFAYNTFSLLDESREIAAAFEAAWTALATETADPNWQFAAVANLNNFSYEGIAADLGHGVSIHGRSFDWLKEALHWDQADLDRLSEDWSAGGGSSSYVLTAITNQPKTSDNFLLGSDGAWFSRTSRALLAMRLLGPGDLQIGKTFLNRPAHFNVGIGGRSSSGWTTWRPGAPFILSESLIPSIRKQIDTLNSVESSLETSARHIGLALRSFSSSYDRMMHQAEDTVIDLITALEAMWKLDAELSFRLAFRTAVLLGLTDHGLEGIFETLRSYYKIRSKIVHGSSLTDKERGQVREYESLRSVVRHLLRSFIHLLANPGQWTLAKLSQDPDLLLLHSARRAALQIAMGIRPAGAT